MPKGRVVDDGDPGNLRGKRIGLIKPDLKPDLRIPFENGKLWRTPRHGKVFRDSEDPTWKKSNTRIINYDEGTGNKKGWAVNLR